MTVTELAKIISEDNALAIEDFANSDDFCEMSEIEVLRKNLEEADQRITYLCMAQHYTAVVGRHLTEKEIDALLACSKLELEIDEYVRLVREYAEQYEETRNG